MEHENKGLQRIYSQRRMNEQNMAEFSLKKFLFIKFENLIEGEV